MDFEHHVDVLDISDLRFPGGTSHSIAEEITAQSRAGYRTGLLHLNGPLVARVHPVNRLIRQHVEAGAADLLIDRRPIRARAAIFRHPAVVQDAIAQLPRVKAEHIIVLINSGPFDIDGHQTFDPAVVDQRLRDRLGTEPVWAPIGPLARAAVRDLLPEENLLADDWVNIIDVDAWRVQRDGWRADRPVVGRHSRSSPQKWPNDAATLRAVYPVDGSWIVRILGGAAPAEALLGSIPPSWEVQPFGAQPPQEFLADLDFFVYYHDHRWTEAFGRTILEAIASGAVAVLPPPFRALFGDAAQYAEPTQVRATVEALRADRSTYNKQVQRAEKITRERFGHAVHLGRLSSLIGPPSAEESATGRGVHSVPPSGPSRPRVLFVSSNGAGMGHLTRLLAYARRIESDAEPHFLSLSQAVHIVDGFGYPYEYLPSSKATGLAPRDWRGLFVERFVSALRHVRPAVVVFDGTWPYEGIAEIRASCPRPIWIWSRRGMWRAGKNHEQLAKAAWFDSVIEPGELAAEMDNGATAAAQAHRVGPVTLLDRDELDDRDTSREALGLPSSGPLALVSLGAGNINDTRGAAAAMVAALDGLGFGVCMSHPPLATAEIPTGDVHVATEFPLSRRYAAFDVAVSAAGYNSFHELMRFGVPTLFVPNVATALDDQQARASFAAANGYARELRTVTVGAATRQLSDLLANGAQQVGRVKEIDPGNGAGEAAAHIMHEVKASMTGRRRS